MFSMAETRRFGYKVRQINTLKLQSILKDLNELKELTNPQKALKDIIEVELAYRMQTDDAL